MSKSTNAKSADKKAQEPEQTEKKDTEKNAAKYPNSNLWQTNKKLFPAEKQNSNQNDNKDEENK